MVSAQFEHVLEDWNGKVKSGHRKRVNTGGLHKLNGLSVKRYDWVVAVPT